MAPANTGKVRVRIEGAKAVPEPELRAVLCIDKPGCAPGASNREVLDRDVLYLQAALYDRGYVQSKVDAPKVSAAADGAIEVTFPIEENDRYKLGAIDVVELDAANKPTAALGGDATVRAFVRGKPGDWFSRAAFVEDLGKLRTHYRDAGYARVEADPETELDATAHTLKLRVPIRRGPLVTIEKVTVTPQSAVQVVVAMAQRVGVGSGARYAETPLVRLKQELAKGGVEVDVAQRDVPGHPDRVIVVVEVH